MVDNYEVLRTTTQYPILYSWKTQVAVIIVSSLHITCIPLQISHVKNQEITKCWITMSAAATVELLCAGIQRHGETARKFFLQILEAKANKMCWHRADLLWFVELKMLTELLQSYLSPTALITSRLRLKCDGTRCDAREKKWRGNNRMEWVTSKCHMTAEHRLARAVQSLQADVYSSPASSRLNRRPPPI